MSHGGADNGIASNAYRLLWAGFMAILAAGVGFAIRGGILDNWGVEFGFTGSQLGAIGGAGFTGFCFGIIIGGVIADKIGYGKLVVAAFLFHVLSAVVALAAAPMPTGPDVSKEVLEAAQNSAYNFLFWGTFLFAIANGTLEAVANPLVATLFPRNRTHYLNILHASWPLGMIIGGAAGWVLDDQMQMPWRYQLALFLVPTLIYGLMFLGQKMPKSEASEKGLSMGDMFKDVGILGGLVVCYLLALFFSDVLRPLFGANPEFAMYAGYAIGGVLLLAIAAITGFSIGSWLLFVLFIAHALVGAVELGTDGWIQNITGNILSSSEGKILFVFTSAVMFGLRFCADFIEKKIGLSPVGILLVCSILACIGLNLTSTVDTFGVAILALTVYAFGKTFFWPTMLAVTSDRFPRTGAVAISIMGGIGMMSAGLLGSTGLGYSKDRFAGEALNSKSPALYAEYKAEKTSKFLFLPEATGLDGGKIDKIQKTAPAERTDDQKAVIEASIQGDRMTLKADSLIPATMAVIYPILLIYFAAIGGYKPVSISEVHTGTDLGTAES
ncbi:MAG: MFS transporter [Planctomycetaceae bacterium]|nr:MFS transporter [Planctomycetaceae bacterium]